MTNSPDTTASTDPPASPERAETSRGRLRPVTFTVQPNLVLDDGENLVPVQVDPIVVPAAQWEEFAAGGLSQAMAHLQAQLDGNDEG